MQLVNTSSKGYLGATCSLKNYVTSREVILGRYISTPVGESVVAKQIYKRCPIIFFHKIMLADLIELGMVYFDLILGMDWLHSSYASLDCRTQDAEVPVPR